MHPTVVSRRERTFWNLLAIACSFLVAAASLPVVETFAAEPDGAAKKNEKSKDGLGQRRESDVGKNEELSFSQSKVTSQMAELEERMFRLSEALKSLEPENASRLLIGLKYAREELIQLQMKEIQVALNTLKYKDAVVEQKQLLAKLQRLEQLLLSPDLDFQLQLERLRLMRELMRRLDGAIAEEEREKTSTDRSQELEAKLKELQKRIASLQEIIQRQTGHIEGTEKLTGVTSAQLIRDEAGPADALQVQTAQAKEAVSPEMVAPLKMGQQETREQTKALEEGVEKIAAAGKSMDQAVAEMEKTRLVESLRPQNAALDSLKQALADLRAEEKQLEEAIGKEALSQMRREQADNRKTTEGISETAVQLGDAGAGARGELMRGVGSMTNAESNFGDGQLGMAGDAQGAAVASLKSARAMLAAESEKLLNRLRAEIKKRTIEGIAQMLEGQIAIRESTERLAPRAKEGVRTVLNSVVALAKAEDKLILIGDGLTTLVEETEFGIALPAALRSVTEEMMDVKDRLATADASEEVIAAEKQVEADLQELLDAMKQLPSQGELGRQQRAGTPGERERQLNRIIAELRMVRMLQVRVNRDTKDVDGKRPEEVKNLPAVLRQRIEALQGRQEDVHDVTERIAVERGDELQVQP